jgi:hypothetical protein
MSNTGSTSALSKGQALLSLSYSWGKELQSGHISKTFYQITTLAALVLQQPVFFFFAKEQSNLPFTKGFFSFLMMY